MRAKTFRSLVLTSMAVTAMAWGAAVLGSATAWADGAWRTSRPMETARSDAAAAVLDNEIYVAGGSSVIGPRDAFEAYDPFAEIWRPLPALPEGRERFGMAALGGLLYLTGGYEKESLQETSDLWIYDPVTSQWREGPGMPAARAGHALVAALGKLYVFGGTGDDVGEVLIYDPATSKWSIAPYRMPAPRAGLAAVADGGMVYLIGGLDAGGHSARIDRLDTVTGTFSTAKSMPQARSGHTAGLIQGRIHITGGVSEQSLKTFSDHDVLDPATGRWSKASPLPTPRHGLVSATVNDRWYVIGGGSGAGFFTVFTEADVVEVFEP